MVSQGIQLPLQIFHTGTERGWGVRCTQGIASGTFIACYAGEGITDSEAVSAFYMLCQDSVQCWRRWCSEAAFGLTVAWCCK